MVENIAGSDLTGSGTASASSSYSGNPASGAFNGGGGSGWGNTNTMPSWLEYDFGSGTVISFYSLYRSSSQPGGWGSNNYSPQNWTFQGSNDNSTWTTLDTETGQQISYNASAAIFGFSNSTAYRYYRIYITTAVSGTYVNITQMRMMGPEASTSAFNVTSYGYVGVGTSSPAQTLEVNGTLGVDGTAEIDTGLIVPLLYPPSDSTTAIQIDQANGTSNVVDIDTTNGRVGIGTTAPWGPLEVFSTAYDFPGGWGNNLRLTDPYPALWLKELGTNEGSLLGEENGILYFGSESANTWDHYNMVLTSNSQLGLGLNNDNPTAQFDNRMTDSSTSGINRLNYNYLYLTPPSDTSSAEEIEYNELGTSGSANYTNYLEGIETDIYPEGTGTVNEAIGAENYIANYAPGLTYAYGGYNEIANATTGTIDQAYGTETAIENDNASGTINAAYALYNEIDNSGTMSDAYGIYNGVVSYSGSTMTSGYGYYGEVENYSTNAMSYLEGIENDVENNAGGSVSYGYGDYSGFYNELTGAVGTAYGGRHEVYNDGTGTITDAYGEFGYAVNYSGTISNAYGVIGEVDQLTAGGTVTDAFSLYSTVDQRAGTISNWYGLYVVDEGTSNPNWYSIYTGTTPSYFGGNVGIGTATPANQLDVKGSLAVGTYAGTASGTSNELIVGGSVGIGTTNPPNSLSVRNPSSPQAIFYGYSAATGDVSDYSGSIVLGTYGSTDQGLIDFSGSGSSPQLTIRNGDNTDPGSHIAFQMGTSTEMTITSTGSVGIGTTSPGAALDVETTGATYESRFNNATTTDLYGVYATLADQTTGAAVYAAETGTGNKGYAGYFTNTGTNAVNYGLYASTSSSTGYAIYTQGNTYLNGTATVTGAVTLSGLTTGGSGQKTLCINSSSGALSYYGSNACTDLSDIRLKRDIVTLPDDSGLNAIMKLRPVRFHWKDVKQNAEDGEQIGLIAQDVKFRIS